MTRRIGWLPGVGLVLLGLLAMWLAATPAYAQATNEPPPPAPEGTAPEKPEPMTAFGALDKVNTAKTLIFKGALLTAPAEAGGAMAKSADNLFKWTGRAYKAGEVGTELYQGRTGYALRKGTAAVIDECIDKAVELACAAASAPTAEAGFLPCTVAALTVKACAETYYGKSAGEWMVDKAAENSDTIKSFVSDKRAEQDQAAQSQDAQFAQIESDNASAALAQTNAQAPPAVSNDNGSQAFADALMTGVLAATRPQASVPPPVPLAQPAPAGLSASPTGCHPGHNEALHPGGCHSAPQGSR